MLNIETIQKNQAILNDFANNFLTKEIIQEKPELVLNVIKNITDLSDTAIKCIIERDKQIELLRQQVSDAGLQASYDREIMGK